MKIIRDGKEFELTFSELMQAYFEYELDCMVDDIQGIYEQGEYDIDLSDEQIKDIAEQALNNLRYNDSYYEAHWMSVQYTLDQYISNLPEEDDKG